MDIEANNVGIRFDRATVLDGVNFAVRRGEMVGLIGPNGSGKTTLLRILANLLLPQLGSVHYDGQTSDKLGLRELAKRVAYLAQGGAVHWALRVESVVSLGRLPHRRPFQGLSAADADAIDRAILLADIDSLRDRTMTQISGGERMRVLLARALAVEAESLLADEPTAALDPLHQLRVMELLRTIAHRGCGVVVVLHDLSLAVRFCDRLALLANGRVVAQGTPEQVLTDEYIAGVYGVEVIRGEHDGTAFLLPWRQRNPTQ